MVAENIELVSATTTTTLGNATGWSGSFAMPGETITVLCKIRNSGTSNIRASTGTYLELKIVSSIVTHGVWANTLFYDGSESVDIDAGATKDVSFTWTVPTVVKPGYHHPQVAGRFKPSGKNVFSMPGMWFFILPKTKTEAAAMKLDGRPLSELNAKVDEMNGLTSTTSTSLTTTTTSSTTTTTTSTTTTSSITTLTTTSQTTSTLTTTLSTTTTQSTTIITTTTTIPPVETFLTPHEFTVDPGKWDVKVTNTKYEDASFEITVVAGEERNVVFELTAKGKEPESSLRVISNQSRASISLQKIEEGKENPIVSNWYTPETIKPLEPGTYNVSVEKAKFVKADQTVTLEPFVFKEISFELEEVPENIGTVRIISTPTNADVEIDGIRQLLLSSAEYDVEADVEHEFSVMRPGYKKPPPIKVTVEKGDVIERFVQLEKEVTTGTIKVKTTPPSATIFANGVDRGLTDKTLELAPGEYSITVSRPGYFGWDFGTITIAAGEEKAIFKELVKVPPSGLDIESTPPNAKITIGGVETVFNTPKKIEKPKGSYPIKLTFAGYKDWESIAAVEEGLFTDVHAEMIKIAASGMNISSSPSNASIFINETPTVYKTSKTVEKPEGTYNVLLKLTGYEDAPQTVEVLAGEFTDVHATMTKIEEVKTGVNVVSNPPYAHIFSKISGEVEYADSGFITPHGFTLALGSYDFKLTRNLYQDWVGTITVETGKVKDLFAELKESEEDIGTIEVTSTPSNAQVKIQGLTVEGITTTKIKVAPGTYIIQAMKSGYIASEGQSITVAKGETKRVHFDLVAAPVLKTKGTLSVKSNPSNAFIELNGVSTGRLTPENIELDPGVVEVLVIKEGYDELPTSVEITAGELSEVFVELKVTKGAEKEAAEKKAEEEAKIFTVPEGWPWTLEGVERLAAEAEKTGETQTAEGQEQQSPGAFGQYSTEPEV